MITESNPLEHTNCQALVPELQPRQWRTHAKSPPETLNRSLSLSARVTVGIKTETRLVIILKQTHRRTRGKSNASKGAIVG